jgi:hypothetical protein
MPYGGSKFKGGIRKTSVVAARRKDVIVDRRAAVIVLVKNRVRG